MELQFDFEDVKTIEFGIGRDDSDTRTFFYVPVDMNVQTALYEMAELTWRTMGDREEPPAKYEPSEKHGNMEYVYLSLDDHLCGQLGELHKADNLPVDATALSDPEDIFCYFVRMTDGKGQRLTALHRAVQFKGVLRNRLVRIVNDALRIIEDKVFKLDLDFDLLIDAENIHILRPSSFEFTGQLKEAILASAPGNIRAIQNELPFVDFDSIESYSLMHARAARYLASIRSQGQTRNIDKQALRQLCSRTGVEIRGENGMICVEDGHVMGFLEVLDRRRYEIGLVPDSPECYRAASRQKLGGGGT